MTKKIGDSFSSGPVMREDAARAYAAVGPTKFNEMIEAGEFPKPIVVGSRRRWLTAEVTAWLADRIAKRDAASSEAAQAAPERAAPAATPTVKKLKLRRPVKALTTAR
jgi:predicted DNA-binding transcriptional regulator AlpA